MGRQFLENQLGSIQYELETHKTDYGKFHGVAAIIVSISHDIYDRRGRYGHHVRQKIRWQLWKEAKRIFPELRKFKVVSREFDNSSSYAIVGYAGREHEGILKRLFHWLW